MEKIGLISGNRKFPLLFCQAARKRGYEVLAVAIKGETSREIKKVAKEVFWLSLADYSRMFGIFKDAGISKIVMAGQISPFRLFTKEIAKDRELQNILRQVKDKKADTIFGAIANRLKDYGLELLDSTLFMEEFLPKKGALAKREPTFSEWEDVYFGLVLAKEIGFLDIGQTVAVKDKAVIAVEALEGTDNLIRRAGRIAGSRVVIVKVSKPNQDTRFDIPVVGLNTVKNLIKIKAAVLAIEAEKTLFIDQKASINLADKHNLSVVAV